MKKMAIAMVCSLGLLSSPLSRAGESTDLPYSFWKNVAFEIGFGVFDTQEKYPVNDDDAFGYTVGIGHKVGRGVLMLRYSRHDTDDVFSEIGSSLTCELFSDERCARQEAHYDAISLMYRERPVTFMSWGLGLGTVKRTLEEVYRVQTGPDRYESADRVLARNNRAALFYELMFQIPIHRRSNLSLGLGVQGQYNKDYPSNGFMIAFQKGM